MTEWNRVFWLVFIVLGAIVIAGSMVHILYLDLIFGLLVIGVGVAKLAEEITDRRLQKKHAAMNESIGYLTRQVDSTTGTAERLKDTSDSRFFKIHNRLNEIDETMDDKYDDAVRKVITLENRLNEHSKMMLELAKRQEAIKGRQDMVGERLRHLPRMQPKPVYRPVIVHAPAPRPQTIFVPRAATVPEKRIMRFELPRIAPKRIFKLKPKARKVRRKAARQAPTIINIAAPKPQVIKKIIKVRPKPKPKIKRKVVKRRPRRRIVTSGRTIINIQAPKPQIIRKVVRVKAKPKPAKKARPAARPAKRLKRKAPKKVKAKNIAINIS